ncbi:helix-turn-helix domain-containing protein [Rhizobium rhizogenes]|uniref:helix-turn-helix domain-containing protein n=1 Tax=Rhizobium rhizogenes TaxID=359 RepID=UPI0015728DA4|nr:helix-turn-helix transcriptional regulator [Rhizobium rhizogenes]NTI36097.1 helix-turn-helix transcriptional regulator [Rhizobium rhizogenes]WEO64054.1 helix-turn-helix transcriptional regulator [Rhizobium rhizogenes]
MHDRVTKALAGHPQRQSARGMGVIAETQAIHPIDRHVGQQLRIIRIHSNLSQTELGHKVDLSYQQIQKYESGKNRMSASVLYEIANCLNVPISRFYDGLPQAGSELVNGGLPEIDERIAYLATSEGRRFVEEILRLPPRLRTRTFALIQVLTSDEEETAGQGAPANAETTNQTEGDEYEH